MTTPCNKTTSKVWFWSSSDNSAVLFQLRTTRRARGRRTGRAQAGGTPRRSTGPRGRGILREEGQTSALNRRRPDVSMLRCLGARDVRSADSHFSRSAVWTLVALLSSSAKPVEHWAVTAVWLSTLTGCLVVCLSFRQQDNAKISLAIFTPKVATLRSGLCYRKSVCRL